MKTIRTSIGFALIAATLAAGPAWADNQIEMVNACKDAIPEAISMTKDKRVKLKSIYGAGRVKTVVLQVLGPKQEKSTVLCEIHTRTKEIRSIAEKV